jgi:hypothetical protein
MQMTHHKYWNQAVEASLFNQVKSEAFTSQGANSQNLICCLSKKNTQNVFAYFFHTLHQNDITM